MTRPQSGVNGSMQQHLGPYYPNLNQYPRPPQSGNYPYEQQTPQILPSVNQPGFSAQMPTPHIQQNQMIHPSQFYICQQYPMPSYYNYPSMIQQQYMPEVSQIQPMTGIQQAPKPIKQQPSKTNQRKKNPLDVVDPISNKGVDLTKYSSQKNGDNLSDLTGLTKTVDNSVVPSTTIMPSELTILDPKDRDLVTTNDQLSDLSVKPTVDNLENVTKPDTENVTKPDTENVTKPDTENVEQEIINEEVKQCTIATKSDSETDQGNESDSDEESIPNYRPKVDPKESDAISLQKKLIYDRAYLIKLKQTVDINKKPSFNEDIDKTILMTTPNSDLTSQKPHNYTNMPNKKQAPNRKPYQNFKGKNPPKTINLDSRDSAPLSRTKSGYLPPQLRKKEVESDHMTNLKRNIKSNLNKITPQNFQECLKEILKLKINEAGELTCLINEIFAKAVKEEAYSVTYAQFCNKLATGFEKQSFKGELLKKCQDMFQTPLLEQLTSVREEWNVKIENELDPKMKVLYQNDLEEQVKKAKDKYFGNIRFIGELFLHQLLAGKVIINCICELLKGSDDADSILALCKLLETCGKQIDMRSKVMMNDFIKQMSELSKSINLETRIRFKLKDVIDMRDRNWEMRHVQREKKIRPKTMEEQKAEAAIEAVNKANFIAQVNQRKTQQNVRRPMQNMHSKGSFIVKNLSCSSQAFDDKPILGPSSRNNWSEGSGAKQNINRDSEGWTTTSGKSRNPSIRLGSNSRSREQSPQVSKHEANKNRYRTLELSHNVSSGNNEYSGPDSRSSTPPNMPPPRNVPPPRAQPSTLANTCAPSPASLKSDDEIGDEIFQDLLSKNRFDDASWRQISNIPMVVEKWIDTMMEKDASCRKAVGDNFARLLSEKLITNEQIVQGAQEFVAVSDDLICDIPKLWEFFAQFFERFICDKNSNISFFLGIFHSIIPNIDVAECLSMSLHAASSRLGHQIVGQVFTRSKLDWKQILPESNFDSFIESNSLEFTLKGGVCSLSSGGCSLDSIHNDIQALLVNKKTNEEIFDYMEKHIDKPTWKSRDCIMTIAKCIFKFLKGKPEEDARSYLKDRKEIIRSLLHSKVEHQMDLLKCILEIASELDKVCLTIIYDVLITDNIVNSSVFKSYLNDENLKSHLNFKLTEPVISELHLIDER